MSFSDLDARPFKENSSSRHTNYLIARMNFPLRHRRKYLSYNLTITLYAEAQTQMDRKILKHSRISNLNIL